MLDYLAQVKKPISDKMPVRKHPVRILAIGGPGVGKSTIGNFILGKRKFKTAQSAESCTKDVSNRTVKNVTYVDVPGIPDTEETRTREYYDMIVNEAKEELNFIFFVFQFERINPAKFKNSRLLFRQLDKTDAIKILIINNKDAAPPDQFSDDEDKKEENEIPEELVLAESIKKYVGINFFRIITMNNQTMKEQVKKLKESILDVNIPPKANPELMTFDELARYVKKLKQDHEARKNAVIKDAKERKKKAEDRLLYAKTTGVGAGLGAGAAASTIAFATGPVGWSLIAGAWALGFVSLAGAGSIKMYQDEIERCEAILKNPVVEAKKLKKEIEDFENLKKLLLADKDDGKTLTELANERRKGRMKSKGRKKTKVNPGIFAGCGADTTDEKKAE